jgi:hypothetical protein
MDKQEFLKGLILGKLKAEGCQDNSDAELDRCLSNTVNPRLCLRVAHEMRENGELPYPVSPTCQ